MGMGHVPAGPVRQEGQGDDLPRRQHRRAGAVLPDLSGLARDRARLGALGEEVAARFLAGRGGVVVARNVEVGGGEIDLVVRWADGYAAVEVRTVGPHSGAEDPLDRITEQKMTRVARLARLLASRYGPMRVDFVGVGIGFERVTVRWLGDLG
ncbi:MAG: YraN family protein [Acidimicrobiia bacterium]